MNTPIHNFVKAYRDLRPIRLHMPGHKGRGLLGCEELDLTEIPGADSLYEADGIIAESEANASALFGCPTFYSTEGSSHCIRAMLALAMQAAKALPARESPHSFSSASRRTYEIGFDAATGNRTPKTADGGRSRLAPLEMKGRFRVLAARNVHRAFLTAAALLDLDVCWLPVTGLSYLSANPTPAELNAALSETGAAAVYLTCPDYLGKLPALSPLAEVCHAHRALLLVDNAHGAYLRFLTPSRHPIDLGADLCCDSAHKTLPVLTGGAYLHLSPAFAETMTAEQDGQQAAALFTPSSTVKNALALFGSTSPSYLILQSLDLANSYLETLPERLAAFLQGVEALKARLRASGWRLIEDEPLKLTLDLRPPAETNVACPTSGSQRSPDFLHAGTGIACPPSGTDLASMLEQQGIFCEFADADFIVFMLSPENTARNLERLETVLVDIIHQADDGERTCNACPYTTQKAPTPPRALALPKASAPCGRDAASPVVQGEMPEVVCSIREAMLAPAVTIPAAESLGRILARPGVSCPPAVPILMPGERIDAAARDAFAHYGIKLIQVL